jgi:8-oxo-dGTP pyrophosphatase MutT (NUDIX family)
MALDYDNFKNEVATRHSGERAAIYHDVWHACRTIQKKVDPRASVPIELHAGTPSGDRTAEYRIRDLHAEGEWPGSAKPRYGSVIFDNQGRVLLREPSGHFDDYHWTFAKGASNPGEHPVDTALRETREEMGHCPVIIGHLRGAFSGSRVGATAYYYLMLDSNGMVDPEAMQRNRETNNVRWATYQQAKELISQTTNSGGRARDLKTLDTAFKEWGARTVT